MLILILLVKPTHCCERLSVKYWHSLVYFELTFNYCHTRWLKLFSCEGAALEVLMSVCLPVPGQVEISGFMKVCTLCCSAIRGRWAMGLLISGNIYLIYFSTKIVLGTFGKQIESSFFWYFIVINILHGDNNIFINIMFYGMLNEFDDFCVSSMDS